ncbi:MAG: serine hydrolase [Bacillota bacterium]
MRDRLHRVLWLVVAVVVVAASLYGAIERRRPGTPASSDGNDPAASDLAPDYGPLKAELGEYIASQSATYGIYFRDLESGASFGINEDEPITAASTVKMPVVLYLNHLVAEGRANWNDRVVYNSATDYQDGAGILQFSARDGDSYSLRTLANLAITISDNVAYRMLVRHLGKDNIAAFMRDLGGEMVFPGGENITCAKDMAAYVQGVLDFARTHPDLGSRLLDDMANPIYHVGLPGKLPQGLTVAHKEGDVWGVANDIGVVFSSRPYILVVLSKNIPDIDQGFARIAEVSKIVYDYQNTVAA